MSAPASWSVRTREGGHVHVATARLLDDALLVEHALGVRVVELAALDGIAAADGMVTLYHHAHGALALEATDAAAIGLAVESAATRLPELAASLRALGSPRAHPGADHDAWFGPLVTARRRAHEASTARDRLAAFDAAALGSAADAALVAFGAHRWPASAARARAMAEALRDAASAYPRSLRDVAARRRDVEAASDADRLAEWRAWVAALRAAFVAADGAWEAMQPVRAAPRPREDGFWRRALTLGRRR